jgi:hypothetical protein
MPLRGWADRKIHRDRQGSSNGSIKAQNSSAKSRLAGEKKQRTCDDFPVKRIGRVSKIVLTNCPWRKERIIADF